MTINEAKKIGLALLETSSTKRERRIYTKLAGMLTALEKIDLTTEQVNQIESFLENLHLTSPPENKRKFYAKQYGAISNYLLTKHSLSTEGYYMAIGLSLGVGFGAGLGITFGAPYGEGTGISIGLSMGAGLGMVIGMMIGMAKDANAKKQGKQLITKLD
jgi:hypothetical protein